MKIMSESITTYSKGRIVEAETKEKDSKSNERDLKVIKYLSGLTADQFNKLSRNKFRSETITDLELPLQNYIAVEEYMDSFIDWAMLKINGEDASVETLLEEEGNVEKATSKLFSMFVVSDELEDIKKDTINLPEVQRDVEKASDDVDLEDLISE